MNGPTTDQRVFISYAQGDTEYASRLRELLTNAGLTVLSGDEQAPAVAVVRDATEEQAAQATTNIVLIGPNTRFSKWVDAEIELATKPSKSGPGAGLIGVVLPTHDDYTKPYYEPELVPLRLHDRIQGEYATLKKWSNDPKEITQWIADADRRRHRYDATPSVRALLELRHFPWSEGTEAQVSAPAPDATAP